MNRIITENKPDKDNVLIMVEDEGRFGGVNIPKNYWAPMGIRPKIAKQVGILCL